jgi:hypothetical protein
LWCRLLGIALASKIFSRVHLFFLTPKREWFGVVPVALNPLKLIAHGDRVFATLAGFVANLRLPTFVLWLRKLPRGDYTAVSGSNIWPTTPSFSTKACPCSTN